MKKIISLQNSWKFIFPVLLILMSYGCEDEDPTPTPTPAGDDPIASFQYEIDSVEFLKVNFSNFSQNATTYSWDFGDGATSTQESPSHTYNGGGTYTVTLTASDGTNSAEKSEVITVTDPDQQLALIAGTVSKTWYLQREGIALGIGPALGDNQWWSFGGVTPLGDRPCILDDAYTFYRNGAFENFTAGTVFVDAAANGGWKADEACLEESDPDALVHFETGEDLSDFANGGDYSYVFDNASSTLVVNGSGSYIGLPVKTNAGDNYLPVSTKTYEVFNVVDGDVADSLHLALQGDGFSWNFYLVSYDDISNLPSLPSAVPNADFSVIKDQLTVEFLNMSANATTFAWDFGDGNTSTEEAPTHTYLEPGAYNVTLTVEDANSLSDSVTKEITVSDSEFSAAAMSSESGKVWKLAGEASYIVGSSPGAGDFWAGLDANGVIERACQLDDEFILADGGALTIDVKEEVWSEPYMGGSNACVAVADLPAPFDAFGGGDFNFVINEGSPSTITVGGTGAYLGFNKPINGAELAGDGSGTPASEITYDVIGFLSTPEKDQVTLAIDYVGDGCCYWTITLESFN